MKRPPRAEPVKCICEPGAVAAKEHARPGSKTAVHLNAKCPHSELAHTTKPTPKTRGVARIRL